MKRACMLFLSAVILLSGCSGGGSSGGSGGSPNISATVSLSSISITPANPTLPLGGTSQLAATGTYTDGSTRDVTALAVWRSSNPATATVGGGTVTTVAVGTTTVTAALDGISGTCEVTVTGAIVLRETQLYEDGMPAIGATAAVIANGHVYQAQADQSGNYVLVIPPVDALTLPNTFTYTVSQAGYIPLTYVVTKGGSITRMPLKLIDPATIVTEQLPVAHHLGDEVFPDFQEPSNEGLTYTCSFNLAAQPSNFPYAYISFTHRGVETVRGFRDVMIINPDSAAPLIISLPESPPNPEPAASVLRVDAGAFLSNRENKITLKSERADGGTDYDDFEFVNLQVSFGNLRTAGIAEGQGRTVADDWPTRVANSLKGMLSWVSALGAAAVRSFGEGIRR